MKAAPWHGSTLQEQCGQAAVGAQIGEVYLWKHLLKGKYLMVCIFWQRRRGWHGSSYHTCSVWSPWLQRTCAFHGRLASIWRGKSRRQWEGMGEGQGVHTHRAARGRAQAQGVQITQRLSRRMLELWMTNVPFWGEKKSDIYWASTTGQMPSKPPH